MATCSKCHQRLTDVEDRGVHPMCAPPDEVWVTPEQLAELATRFNLPNPTGAPR